MGRPLRPTSADVVFHVLNRANARRRLFDDDGDYAAFERVLTSACARVSMRLLAYCAMPNHWHLVVWPRQDGDLSRFMNWLTLTHTQRWHQHRHSVGEGHVYQGRFKSFPVETNEYLLTVCRYVERNALRANLVERAEEWRWSSLWHRVRGNTAVTLDAWPVPVGSEWLSYVNRAETEAELKAVRRSVVRGTPFGHERWQARTAKRLALESTLRMRGRPRKIAAKKPN